QPQQRQGVTGQAGLQRLQHAPVALGLGQVTAQHVEQWQQRGEWRGAHGCVFRIVWAILPGWWLLMCRLHRRISLILVKSATGMLPESVPVHVSTGEMA